MPGVQQHRDLEIFTPLGKDKLLLLGMNVKEELGRLFMIDVELASTENITFERVLGQNVSIRMKLTGGECRFFNGYVSSISQAIDEGNFARYNATIKPWLWFLTRTSDCRIFQHLTVPEIIKQVCYGLGFTDIKDRLSTEYRTWEYCVQYRETDFNFLSRLMEQEGIYYYFTHLKGKHWLNLADSHSSHESIPGYELINYFPPDSIIVRNDQFIDNWFVSKKVQPGSYATNEYDFVKPRADLNVGASIAREHSQAEHEVFDYPGEYVKNDEGEKCARTRIEELQIQYEEVHGQGIARGLMSGGLFSLANYPREDQNREYLVESVNHSMRIDDFEADGRGGVSYRNSFTIVESRTPYRTARITPKPVVQGPQTAIVVGPSEEEIYTNEHMQVKLQFRWDRYGKFDENSSCWVRVSQIWAGKKWGGVHIPRIGQEVIVEFLDGDPDRPIVTGRVYNGDQPPPYDLPANKTQSGVKSRSTKEGTPKNYNELRFEDKKDKEEIYMHAERNLKTIVESDESRNVYHNRATIIGTKENMRPNESIETSIIWGTRVVNVHGNDGLVVMDGDEGRKVVIEDGDHILEVEKGDNVVTVKQGNHVESIELGKKTVEAMQNIEFKVGSSSIKIDPSGITLDGPVIKLNGTVVELEAKGVLKEKAPVIMKEGTGVVMIKGGVVLIN